MRSSWKSAVALAAFAAAPQLLGSVQGGRSDSTGFLSYPTAAGSSSWVGRCGAVTSAVNRQGVVPTGGRSVNVVMMAENETASSERRPRRQKKESGGPAAHFAQLKVRLPHISHAPESLVYRHGGCPAYGSCGVPWSCNRLRPRTVPRRSATRRSVRARGTHTSRRCARPSSCCRSSMFAAFCSLSSPAFRRVLFIGTPRIRPHGHNEFSGGVS